MRGGGLSGHWLVAELDLAFLEGDAHFSLSLVVVSLV